MKRLSNHFFRNARVSLLWAAAFAASSTMTTAGQTVLHASSGIQHCSLIELYSSEGCSSCPPADEWLTGLKNDERLWKKFVPLSFHVDYWDYLGWKDKWAKPEFTERQRDYSRSWGTGSIYTPGFVVDGKEWRSWGGKSIPVSTSQSGVLTLDETAPENFTVHFEAAKGSQFSKLTANLVLLGFDISSAVHAGENSGRTLRHDFVVLSTKTKMMSDEKAVFEMKPPEKPTALRYAIAVWLTDGESLQPIQATGGWWQQ